MPAPTDELKNQIAQTIKDHPIAFLLAVLMSGINIAGNIMFPLEFINGFNALQNNDIDAATGHLVSFASWMTAAQMSPIVQEKLLIRLSTKLGARFMEKALNIFFHMPKDTANRANGDNHKIVNVFGANEQPGGIMVFYQILMDMITGVLNILALNIVMWIKLGKVASLNTAQSLLFILAASLMSKYSGKTFESYIKDLYRGFSKIIVFADKYVFNKLFRQQASAIQAFMNFIKDELIPKTIKALQSNANFLLIPLILGWLTLVPQLIWSVHKHLLTQDQFILLILYSYIFVQTTYNLVRRAVEAFSSFGLLNTEVLDYLGKAVEPPSAQFSLESYLAGLKANAPAINIQGVSYTHPATKRVVFEKVNYTITQGQIVFLTGNVGSGKSTLFDILNIFAKPNEGTVFFAGHDISKFHPDSVLAIGALVTQTPEIIDGTFKSNICLRCPNATSAQVEWAMRRVGLIDSPTKGSKNYNPDDKIQFDRGNRPSLSGGEQRKLMLARLFLEIETGMVKIAYLDESESNLDYESQELIFPELFKLLREKGVTTIIITQDPNRLKKFVTPDQELDMNQFSVKEAPVDSGAAGHRNSFHAKPPTETQVPATSGDTIIDIATIQKEKGRKAMGEVPKAAP